MPELMDDPNLDRHEHARALAGIRRLNIATRSGRSIVKSILSSAVRRGLQHLSILDLGCGSGDVAATVQREISRKLPCNVTGWDISSTAIEMASSLQTQNTHFEVVDAFAVSHENVRQFDFVYCSLFLHHFSQQQAVELLKTMQSLAKNGVIIDDLLRSTLGLCLAHLGCRCLTRSPVVHFDGPQSVRAAFSLEEMAGLANDSGLIPYTLHRHWPERFIFKWEAPNR